MRVLLSNSIRVHSLSVESADYWLLDSLLGGLLLIVLIEVLKGFLIIFLDLLLLLVLSLGILHRESNGFLDGVLLRHLGLVHLTEHLESLLDEVTKVSLVLLST